MKPQDLRLGNWVYVKTNGNYEQINNLHDNFGTFVEGIKLTEELIEASGFIETKPRSKEYFKDNETQFRRMLRIKKHPVHDGFMIIGKEFILCTLQYVHELQNLYYLLTGFELDIKLVKKNPTK